MGKTKKKNRFQASSQEDLQTMDNFGLPLADAQYAMRYKLMPTKSSSTSSVLQDDDLCEKKNSTKSVSRLVVRTDDLHMYRYRDTTNEEPVLTRRAISPPLLDDDSNENIDIFSTKTTLSKSTDGDTKTEDVDSFGGDPKFKFFF